MKKMFELAVVVALVFVLSGCASMVQRVGDTKRYPARRDMIIAGYEDVEAFYDVQQKSYRAGKGGHVEEFGVKAVAPGHREFGYVVNLRTEPVNVVIKGPLSKTVSLPAAIDPNKKGKKLLPVRPVMKKIDLIPGGPYTVQYFKNGESWSYDRSEGFYVNTQGGDTEVEGIDAEELEKSILEGGATPEVRKVDCDFSIIAQ